MHTELVPFLGYTALTTQHICKEFHWRATANSCHNRLAQTVLATITATNLKK